jgi:2-(1,2-epoxy-1,2-dihydrophenyl)acetyl-CoA isomerase
MSITIEDRGAYRVITLNRPERLNALTLEMAEALTEALEAAEKDRECRALLLTGAGRGFCAGQDLTEIAEASAAEIGDLLDAYHPVILKLRALPIPVVCAVNGVAAGAGANLALACDIVLAAQSASFVQAFARVGLIPDCGGTWLLPRLLGEARARALSILAEPVPAETAAQWGMIWRAIPDEQLIPEAEALAARLAAGPTAALGLIKQAFEESAENELEDQLDLEAELQEEAAENRDFAEGLRAFLEKRPAVFSGRR